MNDDASELLYKQFGIDLKKAKEISEIIKEHIIKSEKPEILIKYICEDNRLKIDEMCFACFYIGLSIGQFTERRLLGKLPISLSINKESNS